MKWKKFLEYRIYIVGAFKGGGFWWFFQGFGGLKVMRLSDISGPLLVTFLIWTVGTNQVSAQQKSNTHRHIERLIVRYPDVQAGYSNALSEDREKYDEDAESHSSSLYNIAIMGDDERRAPTANETEFSKSTGKIASRKDPMTGERIAGTGTLVGNDRLVLSSWHVFFYDDGSLRTKPVYFIPEGKSEPFEISIDHLTSGQFSGMSGKSRFLADGRPNVEFDYIVAILKKPTNITPARIKQFDRRKAEELIRIASTEGHGSLLKSFKVFSSPADLRSVRNISVSPNCGPRPVGAFNPHVKDNVILHNCDTIGGSSGGAFTAVFGNRENASRYVLGIHSGGTNELEGRDFNGLKYYNTVTPVTSHMLQLIRKAMSFTSEDSEPASVLDY